MKLATQLTVTIVGVVLVTATSIGLLTYQSVESVVLPGELERAELRAQLLTNDIAAFVNAAREDILGFRSTALQGIIRSSLNNGVDPRDGGSLEQWRTQLSRRIVAELAAKPAYASFRLMGAADGGREIIRVDRSGPNGTIRSVGESELKQRGDRDYFKTAISLGPDDVYVSPIELRRAAGAVTEPHLPRLRVARMIMAPNGAPFGVAMINVDMQAIFDRIRGAAAIGQNIYVVDAQGNFLVHPDPGREFGVETGHPYRWQDEFPGLAAVLGPAMRGNGLVDDTTGHRVGVAMSSIRLAGGPRIAVISTTPYAVLAAAADAARQLTLLVGFLAVVGALGLAMLAARSLTKPFVQMTAAVEGFSRGDAVAIPTEAPGEIGLLARAFARTLGEIKDKTAALEQEVQAHRNTEMTLARQADRARLYNAAVLSSVDAIITKTLDGLITGWNPAAERLFGFTAEEAVGKNIEIIVPENRRAELHDILARIGRGGIIDHHETVRQTKAGGLIDVSLSISPITLASGEIVGACKIARDITEQKLTEEKFKFAVDASPSGMLMADHAGRIVMVNTEIERIFGYRRDELIGRPVDMLLPEKLRTRHGGLRRDYAKAPATRRMGANLDLYGQCKDGSVLPIEVGLNPIQTRDGILVLGTVLDLTERKRLDQLKHEFVSTVSHELRTPLTSISGALGLVMGTAGNLPAQAQRLLAIALSNSQRLVKLVNDILDIEKLESGQLSFRFKVVDIRSLVEQTIEANMGFADTYLVRLRHELISDGEVWADPDRLTQVVTNLISNAIKFSPPDGEVVVAVEPRGARLRLSVRDQGAGIPAEFKPRIFQKFAQADGTNTKKTSGTGLGLSIAKEIVARLDGEIGFDDAPGGGTIFYVDLPCSDEHAALPPSEAAREKIA